MYAPPSTHRPIPRTASHPGAARLLLLMALTLGASLSAQARDDPAPADPEKQNASDVDLTFLPGTRTAVLRGRIRGDETLTRRFTVAAPGNLHRTTRGASQDLETWLKSSCSPDSVAVEDWQAVALRPGCTYTLISGLPRALARRGQTVDARLIFSLD